jgi:hypothetical protein
MPMALYGWRERGRLASGHAQAVSVVPSGGCETGGRLTRLTIVMVVVALLAAGCARGSHQRAVSATGCDGISAKQARILGAAIGTHLHRDACQVVRDLCNIQPTNIGNVTVWHGFTSCWFRFGKRGPWTQVRNGSTGKRVVPAH